MAPWTLKLESSLSSLGLQTPDWDSEWPPNAAPARALTVDAQGRAACKGTRAGWGSLNPSKLACLYTSVLRKQSFESVQSTCIHWNVFPGISEFEALKYTHSATTVTKIQFISDLMATWLSLSLFCYLQTLQILKFKETTHIDKNLSAVTEYSE